MVRSIRHGGNKNNAKRNDIGDLLRSRRARSFPLAARSSRGGTGANKRKRDREVTPKA